MKKAAVVKVGQFYETKIGESTFRTNLTGNGLWINGRQIDGTGQRHFKDHIAFRAYATKLYRAAHKWD